MSTMYDQLVHSALLCSPLAPLQTPTGAWVCEKAASNLHGAASSSPATVDSKAPSAPHSPDSTKSAASSMSRKRSRSDDDAEAPAPKKAAEQPPNTRPTRTRRAPIPFSAAQEGPRRALPSKKRASKVFDPVFITTNAKSRLGKADVYHMLLKDEAWTVLTVEQKKTLLLLLPASPSNTRLLNDIVAGTAAPTARPREFTISFDLFRTDVAKFIEDLRNGHLGKQWQAAARQSVQERAQGAYDEWKDQEAEAWWGQK